MRPRRYGSYGIHKGCNSKNANIQILFLSYLHFCCYTLYIRYHPYISFYIKSPQVKYRKCSHMKIASASGVLGEKVMIDSIYNSLVNDQGKFVMV